MQFNCGVLAIDNNTTPNFEAGREFVKALSNEELIDSCIDILNPEISNDPELDNEVIEKLCEQYRERLFNSIKWIEEEGDFLCVYTIGNKKVWITGDRSDSCFELDSIFLLLESGVAEKIGFDYL